MDNSAHGIGLLHLLPIECSKKKVDDDLPPELVQAVEFYKSDLPQFPMEYRMWIRKWQQNDPTNLPCKLVDVL